ncbi:MAG: 2-C-methyl-D-erythritol 4-phosphate cytidylyltransferase [Acidimicrobiaceae bacterium]|nr:2-C-methyl-D-erythritol 4-phosphate cytidylyltransferase [Acidimicrobiaceae bacterium]
MTVETWAIVVAGGEGRRFGAPKQFAPLRGRPVLAWALEGARAVADGIVLVVPEAAIGDGSWLTGADVVVAGGATRAASVRAGLAAVPATAEIVVVHDAARPLASAALFRAVVEAVESGADGAIPGVAVSDTIKRVAGGRVVETLERSELVAVQTPQAFRATLLRSAHDGDPDATDDAGLLELIGAHVAVVAGEATNVKLTGAGDLALLESFLDATAAGVVAGPTSGVGAPRGRAAVLE